MIELLSHGKDFTFNVMIKKPGTGLQPIRPSASMACGGLSNHFCSAKDWFDPDSGAKENTPLKGCYLLAPGTGFEPAASKLTASCSTTELSRITGVNYTFKRSQGQLYNFWRALFYMLVAFLAKLC